MDLGTGRTYETRDAAIAAGVSPSDVVDVREMRKPIEGKPLIQLSTSGPFKHRRYVENGLGQLVRVR